MLTYVVLGVLLPINPTIDLLVVLFYGNYGFFFEDKKIQIKFDRQPFIGLANLKQK